jgi:hypothetical protein
MALHEAIETIHREPRHDIVRSSGYERRSSLYVKICLKKAYWGTVDPEDLLADDRLPAAYSSWPVYPYPQTNSAGTLLTSYAVKDALRILQQVTLTSQDTFSTVNFRYDYDANPAVPPGSLPAELRQNPEGTTPGDGMGFKLSYDYEEVELPYTIDADENKVVISSGERPDPLPTVKYILRVANVTRLEKKHRPDWHDQYAYTLNQGTWSGRTAERVCCFPVRYGEWQQIGGDLWWQVNYQFKWLVDNTPADLRPTISKEDFWRDVILSMSTQQKLPGVGLRRILLPTGPATVPQGLDADGKYIDPPNSADVHKTVFKKIKLMAFGPLDITLPPEVV